MLDINANVIKSYATEENLIKALDKLKINDHPHLTVRNAEGRWTAVFLHSNFNRQWLWGKEGMSYLAFYAEKGFMTVG